MTSMEGRAEAAGGGAGRSAASQPGWIRGSVPEAEQLRVDEGWCCIMGLGSQAKRFLVRSSPSQYLRTVFGRIL